MNPDQGKGQVSEEQLRYARWLDVGTRIGLGLLIASFALYVSGLVPPHIPLADLPVLWVLPVDEYLAATGLRGGWSWLGKVHLSDMMNFAGIAFLSLVTVGCYVGLAASYLRKRDTACALIVLAEIVVLVLAASGLVGGAH
jgi:hypothetical protein